MSNKPISHNERQQNEFEAAVECAKLRALYEFAYGAGHEINNPLANISARAQALLRDEKLDDRRQKLAAIVTQAQRAHEMIADLMLFAKPPKLQPSEIELVAWLRKITADQQAAALATGIVWQMNLPDQACPLTADPASLANAVRAVIANAIEAQGEGGAIVLTLENKDTAEYRLSIRDTGPGMDAATRERIFDPFYSGREAGRGLGFGLSKAWRIIDQHGGRIAVESVQGEGSTFTLHLPRQTLAK
jgi:signal transduction histidine kinase